MSDMKQRLSRLPGFYNSLHYRQKLFAAVLLVILPPLLLLSVIYLNTYISVKKNAILENVQMQFGNEVDLFDQKFYSSVKKLDYATNNLQIVYMLKQDYSEDLVTYMDNIRNILPVLEALRSDDPQSQVNIYSFNPTVYRTDRIKWTEDLDPSVAEKVLNNSEPYAVRTLQISPETGNLQFRVYGIIMDISKPLAVTEVVFPVDSIFGQLRELLPDGSCVLYRMKNGTTYAIGSSAAPLEMRPGTLVNPPVDSGSFYRMTVPLKSAQDELLLYVSKSSVRLKLAPLIIIPFAMLAGLLITIFVSIRIVSSLLTRRLTRLVSNIQGELNSMGSNQFLDQVLGNDEFGKLDRVFHGMVKQIEHYFKESVSKEVERRLLEAELLQVRINPHVLYNTLSAIKWKYEDEKLHQLIDDMVDFYRLFLNRGEAEAPLYQEFELIEKYMKMHRFSYAANFAYEITLDKQAGDTRILRNLLQPIVENCLIHGIHQMPTGGKVYIAAGQESGRIRITVRDNGAGMSRTLQFGSHKPDGSGYALSNIQRRVKLYYGEAYGVTIDSAPNEGTTVCLLLPADGAKAM